MKKTVKKVFNICIDVIIILILLISILVVVISLTSKSSGVPNIFGYAPLSVQSNSMSPTFDDGDLIIGQILNAENYDVKVGDVVTFPIEIDGKKVLNTHRVVDIYKDEGVVYYKTQGDNKETNPTPDPDTQSDFTLEAKWTGVRIPFLGSFLSFIRTQLGFFLCILLPMIIFFVYQMIRVILNVIAYNKEKAAEAASETLANAELTEEQKQRAIAEYLAQQKKQAEKSEQDSGSEVQTPAPDDATAPEPDTAQAESDEQ